MNSYLILSDTDEILECGGDWDDFARANDAEGAVASAVVGHKLWDFVEGTATATYLHGILSRSRHYGKAFETTYRCDSPREARMFRMLVTPIGTTLRIDHFLVWCKGLFDGDNVIAIDEYRPVNRCSVCCAFKIGEKWIDPLLIPDRDYFPDTYEVCDTCRDAAGLPYRNGTSGGSVPEFPED